MELLHLITQEPLSAGAVQHFMSVIVHFSSPVHDLAFRLINTKDRVRQAAFKLIIHHPPHLSRENFADDLRTLSWLWYAPTMTF